MQNEPLAHVHHRIAETVGRGWPAWDISEADVAEILEHRETLNGIEGVDRNEKIRREKRWPNGVVEAVLAEASEYGVSPA